MAPSPGFPATPPPSQVATSPTTSSSRPCCCLESPADAAAEAAWARRFLQALQPHSAGGVYVNFLDSDDDASRVREAYGDRTHRRLAEVKAKYDPDNVFHHNKNIQPA